MIALVFQTPLHLLGTLVMERFASYIPNSSTMAVIAAYIWRIVD